MRDPIAREFLLTFWKIHILHHAADGRGVYGQWIIEELSRHGYRLSPGTLYPIQARMAQRGWLRATEPERSKAARVYRLTARGQEVLAQLRHALDELLSTLPLARSVALVVDDRLGRVATKGRSRPTPVGKEATIV